ncbi:serglycin [Hoplias malabaricus]|uniref:serglycin n=1 Tax=Hoplias malabaricus TaxID=27720 RepID=UPI00346243FB
MRFCYRIALALVLVCLLEDNVLGKPTQGRYMWLKCKPNGLNSNCIENKGPLMNLPGPSQRLPPGATKNIVPVESGEDTQETETEEQSGESSGDMDLFNNSPDNNDWMNDAPLQMVDPIIEEQGSGEDDYTNFVFPEGVEKKLPEEDLREDNVMQ